MKSSRTSRLIKSLTFFACCFAANNSFAELVTIDASIIRLLPRDSGLYIKIDSIAAQELQSKGVSCVDNSLPVFDLNRPSYGTTKDALFLAFANNKRIRIYIEKVPALAPDGAVCLGAGGLAPKINSIDVSSFYFF